MNILFLNSAKEWGGNEKWTLAAAEGLASRGHTVYLGCRSPIFAQHASAGSVRIVRIPFVNNYDFLTVLQIGAALLRLKIEMLVPTKQREYFLGGMAAVIFRQVKVVARLGIDRGIENWRNHIAFCFLFDGVIVNAQKIVDVLSATKRFETDICRVIRNGITPPVLSDETRIKVRAMLDIEEKELVICGVGRFTSQKGFDMALDAFALVVKKAPDTRLLLVGDGPDRDKLQQQSAALGIAEKVTFAGFRNDVPDILQSIDLFWLTSRSEGMPNVLLEAMAAGKTACAFDVAGVPEVITDGNDGIIVPFADVAALSTATLRLITDPEKKRLMEREARRTIESEFGLGRMVEATETFLQEVLRDIGRRTC